MTTQSARTKASLCASTVCALSLLSASLAEAQSAEAPTPEDVPPAAGEQAVSAEPPQAPVVTESAATSADAPTAPGGSVVEPAPAAPTMPTTPAAPTETAPSLAEQPAAAPAPEPTAPPPPVEAAPSTPPLKLGASYFTRYEARSGDLPVIGGRPLNADTLFYRARLSLGSAPLDIGGGLKTSVYFEPQASGAYDVGGTALTDVELGLHQGFLSLISPSYKLDVGRFEMAYGEHLVIGNVGWHQTGRAFNGGRIHIAQSPESAFVDVFATLLDDGKLGPNGQNPGKSYIGSRDQYFAGVYAGLGPALGKLDLDVYLLSKLWFGGPLTTTSMDDMGEMTTTTVSAKPATMFTLGSRVKQAVGLLDYRLEAGIQVGGMQGTDKVTNVFAYQADGEVGVKAGGSARIAAHGFIASGDDPDTKTYEGWDQLFPTAHKFLGLTDVFGGRTNVAGAALHATVALSPKVKAALDGHMFFRPQPPDGVKGYAGSEVDVGLAYAIAPSMSLRGLYGAFIPSEKGWFKTDELQHFLEIELAQTIK